MFKIFGCRKKKITTVEEAREAYSNCTCKKQKQEILAVWEDLYLPIVRKMIETRDVKALLDAILDYEKSNFPPIHLYGAPEGVIGDLVRKNLDMLLLSIDTIEEAKHYCNRFQCGFCCNNSNPYVDALEKRWNELSSLEVAAADDLTAIEAAVERSPYNQVAFVNGLIKWANYCQTICDLAHLVKYIDKKGGIERLKIDFRKIIEQKIIVLLFLKIPEISDIKIARSCFEIAPRQSSVRIFAFEQWLRLCSKPEEADEAFAAVVEEGKFYRRKAYDRVVELTKSSS